ncbi:urease accessory protein UreF [Aminobacter sp. UC22_36]|uniref:urease accessory protein UreF n=1 Tax=Aminobacter sp. UC22_36 TaxID=3374549 RepID=UPI00375831F2
MTESAPGNASLLRLMAWLSPAFPVGGFSYSHGLERAVHDGLVASRDDVAGWLATLAVSGSGWNDAVLFAEAWRRARDGGDLAETAELAEALAGSRERHMETMLQGQAFLAAAAAWPHPVLERLPPDCPYCIAVGAAAGAHGIPLEDALAAYLQAFASNLIQAAIRLGVIGQTAATGIVAAFEHTALSTAVRAAVSTLDDLGSAALTSDIMAMRHETQHTRLFRS